MPTDTDNGTATAVAFPGAVAEKPLMLELPEALAKVIAESFDYEQIKAHDARILSQDDKWLGNSAGAGFKRSKTRDTTYVSTGNLVVKLPGPQEGIEAQVNVSVVWRNRGPRTERAIPENPSEASITQALKAAMSPTATPEQRANSLQQFNLLNERKQQFLAAHPAK